MTTAATTSTLIAQLRATGYAFTPTVNDPTRHLTEVVNGWQSFMQMSAVERRRWCFDIEGTGGPDDGYIPPKGGPYDFKHVFHYRPRLCRYIRDAELTEWQRQWMSSCDAVYRTCVNEFYRLLLQLDQELPGYSFRDRANDTDGHVLRLLMYEPAADRGGTIGRRHDDKSLLSIHVADSHPGLRMGHRRTLVEPAVGYTLCFPGKKAEVLTDGALPATWHEISDEDPTTRRWSIVFFGHDPTDIGLRS